MWVVKEGYLVFFEGALLCSYVFRLVVKDGNMFFELRHTCMYVSDRRSRSLFFESVEGLQVKFRVRELVIS